MPELPRAADAFPICHKYAGRADQHQYAHNDAFKYQYFNEHSGRPDKHQHLYSDNDKYTCGCAFKHTGRRGLRI